MRCENTKTIWLKNNPVMRFKICCFLILISTLTVNAQFPDFSYNGYIKDLASSYKLPTSNDRYFDNILHIRLNTRWFPTQSITGALELRVRAFYGSSVENIPNFLSTIKSNHEFTQLDATLWNAKKTIGYGQIDRLWFDWSKDKTEITVGRQRIAWGTSWVWNPIDIFNPLDVLDFDYEERPGADAVRFQYYTGPVSKFELSIRPGKTKRGWIAAGLWSTNAYDYDFNFIGGIKENRWLVGGGWSGDILTAGFRGELLVSQKPEVLPEFQDNYSVINAKALSTYVKPTISFVVSGDYTFINSFYIHTEVLHNSNGVEKYTGLYQPEAIKLGMLTAACWSLYQEFAYDFNPLVRGTIFGILNPDDKSFIIVPSVSYSVITNLDLLLLGMFFNGTSLSEFGYYDNIAFIRLKYSF